jgi:hypothetical protein
MRNVASLVGAVAAALGTSTLAFVACAVLDGPYPQLKPEVPNASAALSSTGSGTGGAGGESGAGGGSAGGGGGAAGSAGSSSVSLTSTTTPNLCQCAVEDALDTSQAGCSTCFEASSAITSASCGAASTACNDVDCAAVPLPCVVACSATDSSCIQSCLQSANALFLTLLQCACNSCIDQCKFSALKCVIPDAGTD